MAIKSRPLQLSEEIDQKLSFTTKSNIDLFTLKSYQYKLEALKKENKLEILDYNALGKVYFHLCKYKNFLSIMEYGLAKYNDNSLLSHYVLGKMMIYDRKLLNIGKFDILKEWFNHPLNPSKLPLNFEFSYGRIFFMKREFILSKAITGYIQINHDLTCSIEIGPFKMVENYSLFYERGCSFPTPLIEIFTEKLQLGSLNQEEEMFMLDILGSANFAEFEKLAKDAVKINEIQIDNLPCLAWNLKKKLSLRIIQKNGFYYVINPELNIYEGDTTQESALAEFYAFFCADFNNWIETPDDSLSDKAKKLKKKYLEYVDYKK